MINSYLKFVAYMIDFPLFSSLYEINVEHNKAINNE